MSCLCLLLLAILTTVSIANMKASAAHVLLHRLIDIGRSDRFYTTDEVERINLIVKFPTLYSDNDRTTLGYLSKPQGVGDDVLIYRYYNIIGKFFTVTTAPPSIQGPGWDTPVQLGYCRSSPLPGMIPLYRLVSTGPTGGYLFTNQNEKDVLTNVKPPALPQWLSVLGATCYVYTS